MPSRGKAGILRLVFRTGKIYDYFQVPLQVFAELMDAASKGRYFNFHIRNRYRFRRIR
ncbi:KTSC domain-containing protein [uncultured Ferrovibrio sp.]|uniref:KTSC domain-containing protein n=1 Tax=uncultured Ferrovibrio sp. TaxID=1576913 RepID=UPI00261B4AB1|nr:KTSC domain-containing protein [uncultured Ferrovibrio sp.]